MKGSNIGNISKIFDTDVVVCGGGCAGVVAAIAAARGGAKVVLLEKQQIIGGTSTAAMVAPFMSSFNGKGTRQIVKGIFDEMIKKLEVMGGAVHPSKTGDGSAYACFYKGYEHRHNNVTPFRADMMQLLMLQMLDEAGVKFLINYTVLDVMKENDKVTGVVGFDGNNVTQYNAKIVIDCTGDGLVCYKAGTIQEECLNEKFEVQPMTIFFQVYGVDDDVITAYAKDHPEEQGMLYNAVIEEAMARGEYIIPRNKIGMYKGLNPGEWSLNCTRIQGMNAIVPDDLTKAYQVGLEQIFFLVNFLKKNIHGFENVKLKAVAPMVGIRETRRMQGVYVLQMKDLIDPPTKFEDCIALSSFLLDLHPANGIKAGIQGRPITADYYEIPYRILVPEKVDGLLAAGRCVSSSRDALSAIRVMPQCLAMGEAAGTAAALCVAQDKQPRALNVKELQQKLEENGAVIK